MPRYPAASMDEPEQRTPPESITPDKPPFIAGLPDAPLERPSDFPDYDGPLVCPFYGPDHPARRDEESKEAFNEDVARVSFGEEVVKTHARLQNRAGFRGDWWFLITLLWASKHLALLSAEQWRSELAIRAVAWEKARLAPGVVRHLERAMLNSVDLRYAILERVHLEHAVLDHARLDHAYMKDARMSGAHMLDTHLGSVTLNRANLSSAYMGYAHLERANMSSATMEGVNLRNADASNANLRLAVLDRAELVEARMTQADLTGAEVRDANLRTGEFVSATLFGTILTGSDVFMANFDTANVRWAWDLLFDDNAVHRLDIQGNARDPWSTLRRTYTGPMFFVHLLLLVAFLLPYAAKVLTLTTTARGYDALRASLDAGEGAPPGAEAVRAWLDHFDASHTDTHAWWVLLGGTHAWWWALVPAALAILGYNVLRGHLTLTIGVLRDQADRVQRTPTLEEYYGKCHPLADRDAGVRRIPAVWWRRFKEWRTGKRRWKNKGQLNPLPIIGPWHLHQLARVLFWISIASVALHVGSWLWTTTVPVPK